ncbi:MAG: NfeD family protein [Fimbriimonadaceae bacterium]|nr:NfeD family protein [Fimbriimonadaceae bacterium]
MFLLYVTSALVAGVLVLLSFLGADHGADHEVGVDHEVTADHDSGTDVHGAWLPFFSLRFYIYFFAGLGTTGLLLTLLAKTPEPWAGIISGCVGLGTGLAVSMLIRALRVSESTSGARQTDMLGKEAEVMVTIRGGTPGRIRLSVKGDILDVLAVTQDGETIDPGASVVVLEMADDKAVVARRENILGDDHVEVTTS